jgi:hypothetical protein
MDGADDHADRLIIALVLTAYCLIGSMVNQARFARRFGPAFSGYRAKMPFWVPFLSRTKGQ